MKPAALENMDTLGAASVSARKLADLAAVVLGRPSADLVSASAAQITFPMFSITSVPFSVVIKLSQSPLLWNGIAQVPPAFRADLAHHYRWRTEAEVYASGLADAMPHGGRLPTLYSIEELDEQRIAIWMEDVTEEGGDGWSDARFRNAAARLGRFAGSAAVEEIIALPQLTAHGDASP
ncbi:MULTISPECIES: hypothetical protein [unclassified Arthrobacter]|uniref:hypothetical protein n=1 Tax=unclassified Arthrobacter TaxID=235627 RepID=UPI0033938AF6